MGRDEGSVTDSFLVPAVLSRDLSLVAFKCISAQGSVYSEVIIASLNLAHVSSSIRVCNICAIANKCGNSSWDHDSSRADGVGNSPCYSEVMTRCRELIAAATTTTIIHISPRIVILPVVI